MNGNGKGENGENEVNEDLQSQEDTIQFLYDYGLDLYLPRIMGNDYLKYYLNLMNISFQTFQSKKNQIKY